MTEKYLGAEHYFAQKFRRRRTFVGAAPEPPADAETPEGEDYYKSAQPEGFPPIQPDEEEVDERSAKRPSARPFVADANDQQVVQKDAMIEQLNEKTRAQAEQIRHYEELLAAKTQQQQTATRELGKKKSGSLNFAAPAAAKTASAGFTEDYSAVSDKAEPRPNKRSFKENSIGRLAIEGEEDNMEGAEIEAAPPMAPSPQEEEAKAKAKEEEMKRMEAELMAKTRKEMEDFKKDKERELKEMREANERQMQEMTRKFLADMQAKTAEEKEKLKEEVERNAKKEKAQLAKELQEAKSKLQSAERDREREKEKEKEREQREQREREQRERDKEREKERRAAPPAAKPEPVTRPPPAPRAAPQPATTSSGGRLQPSGLGAKGAGGKSESSESKNESKVLSQEASMSKRSADSASEEPKVLEGPSEHLYAKLLYNAEHTYKLLVYGRVDAAQKTDIRVSLRCIDSPNIKIKDEVLDDSNIQQILTATALHDVAPHKVLIKGLGNVLNIAKYGVMPFAQVCGSEGERARVDRTGGRRAEHRDLGARGWNHQGQRTAGDVPELNVPHGIASRGRREDAHLSHPDRLVICALPSVGKTAAASTSTWTTTASAS